jgi:hypothetical protein
MKAANKKTIQSAVERLVDIKSELEAVRRSWELEAVRNKEEKDYDEKSDKVAKLTVAQLQFLEEADTVLEETIELLERMIENDDDSR